MTHSDPAPSSIRDDSICESSLNPNKSSGDIVERLRAGPSASTVYGVHLRKYQALCDESAAEIERLRREVEETRSACAQTSNSYLNRALTAESAVAAAWEGIDKLEGGHLLLLAAVKAGDPSNEIIWRIQEELSVIAKMRSRASAIRAAGAGKTAESGHSPSTHNSESE